jgi:hypothetical protein
MSKLTDIRRENGRAAIEKAGGTTKVSKKMGYSNASFLTQQFGPNPTRSPSEGTMRKLEEVIGLDEGSLDVDPSSVKTNAVSTDLISNVIRTVGSAMGQEHIAGLSPAYRRPIAGQARRTHCAGAQRHDGTRWSAA